MFYFPLASTQVWGAGLSGCPLVRTRIARVRRARLGEVMMIKQPGSRGLLRKTRGEEAGGWLYRLARCGWQQKMVAVPPECLRLEG